MSRFRDVTSDFAVASQIAPADLTAAAADGFTLVINNRPDAETPGQPSSDSIAVAAQAAGLRYVHIPVVGRPTEDQVQAMRVAIAAAGKSLAFCRSGTRSIVTWALGRADPRQELIERAAAAGYDLDGVLPR